MTDHFEGSQLASFFTFEPPNDVTTKSDRHIPNNKKEKKSTQSSHRKTGLGIPGNGNVQETSSRQRQLPEQTRIKEVEKKSIDERGQPQTEPKKPVNAPLEQTDGTKEDDRLNIVLLYADDWTMKVLGKFDPNVKTPNIDKMADNGVLFTNNCVTTSVCWISRATLVTGVYYSRHLQFAPHSTNMYTTNPWNETLFPKLKSSGYYTGLMGKWHVPQPEPEMTMAFDKREMYYGDHWSKDYSAHGSDEVMQITDKNLNDAIDFLQTRPRDKPFFLKVSYFATHAWDGHKPPYMPKNETRRKHYPESMFVEPPKTATPWHWENLPRFFNERNEGRSRWKHRFDKHHFQESIKDLYAMATEVDDTVGIIMEELKEQNLLKNTMIIFTTDNGNLHGEHGLAEKW